MGHKIPYLSSLLVTCHLSSRLYSVKYINNKIKKQHDIVHIIIIQKKISIVIWAATRENLSSWGCEHTGAYQPAHTHSLISAFVIRFLQNIIC